MYIPLELVLAAGFLSLISLVCLAIFKAIDIKTLLSYVFLIVMVLIFTSLMRNQFHELGVGHDGGLSAEIKRLRE